MGSLVPRANLESQAMGTRQASATAGGSGEGSESTEGGSERNTHANLEIQCDLSHQGRLLQTPVALETPNREKFLKRHPQGQTA